MFETSERISSARNRSNVVLPAPAKMSNCEQTRRRRQWINSCVGTPKWKPWVYRRPLGRPKVEIQIPDESGLSTMEVTHLSKKLGWSLCLLAVGLCVSSL